MSACDCDERLIHLVIPRQRLALALPHQREVDGADAHDFIRVLKLNSPAIGIPEPVRQGAEKAIESLPLQRKSPPCLLKQNPRYFAVRTQKGPENRLTEVRTQPVLDLVN